MVSNLRIIWKQTVADGAERHLRWRQAQKAVFIKLRKKTEAETVEASVPLLTGACTDNPTCAQSFFM